MTLLVEVAKNVWVNPVHVATIAGAADGGGSILGFVNGLNLSAPESPGVVATWTGSAVPLPAEGASFTLKLVHQEPPP